MAAAVGDGSCLPVTVSVAIVTHAVVYYLFLIPSAGVMSSLFVPHMKFNCRHFREECLQQDC